MRKTIPVFSTIFCILFLAAVGHAGTITRGTIQDAGAMSVYFSSSAATSNYGASEWIHHYNHDYSVINSSYPNYLKQDAFSYFQFDLTGLSTAGLISATFNAYHKVHDTYNSNPNNSRLYTMKTYQLMDQWNESTVTYSNQPTVGNEVGSASFQAAAGIYLDPTPEYDGVVSTDLTSMVMAWLDGTADNFGIKYKMDTNFLSNGHANMVATRDNAMQEYVPSLVLTYEDNGTSPVPEPATMFLFGIGLLGLAGVSRRKK